MDQSALQLVSEIGTNLRRQARPNKDFIVKSLRQAASSLSQLEQASSPEALKKLKPLTEAIVHGLLQHRDKDVRLLVAICVTEMFRVMAPEPPFVDKHLRDVFKLILSTFTELADTASPLFSRRAKIVETVARCKCCVIMLDIDCSDLVLEMFNIFFSVVRVHHQQTLINDVLSVMVHILNEEASQPLLDVVLQNLVKEGKDADSASSQLAVSVIQTCADKLESFVCGFLTSCILDRDAVGSELKEFYHEIIFKIFKCAPQMLLAVIPNLTQELLTDQVDVRLKAVNLIGKLFTLPDHHIAQRYQDLFIEFLKRFSDKSAEVRVSALQCAKVCYMTNPSGVESQEVLSSLEGRLLDFDDRVRTQAVIVACDLAMYNMRCFPPKLISQTTERLRDKKIPVRKKALQKMMEVYRDYCDKCSEGYMTISDHFEQIPCKILMLCFDKDCMEFRSQNMELVLAEDLFPAVLSVEERTRHWIHLFSLFTPLHIKALNSILSQKQRLQSEMRTYLAIRKKEKGNNSEEMQKRYKVSFLKMAVSFADPSKAEECFHKLNQMKDNNIFNLLALLLDELQFTDALTSRDTFLNMIGEKHQNFEFLRTLSSKCSYNIFSSEHVRCILYDVSSKSPVNKHLEAASVRLLLEITSFFPVLLRGSESQFQMLLEESDPINEKLIEVLAKAGTHISVKLSEIYPFLKRVCLEGNRVQSKYAVSAIAALVDTSKQFIFSSLCKELVDSLVGGQNIPTVLQSLGCLAQYSVSTFESQDGEITPCIYQKIFQVGSSDFVDSFNDASGCSDSCKLKIYGLKALVKSFLPHRGTQIKRQINVLWNILSTMLQKGETAEGITSCENDKACIRLAAAKSVLRLSRRWDFHISPEIFHFTISMAKDDSPLVRRLFLDKAHKLLKEHAIPSRYACAFAIATSDCLKDLQYDSLKYMAEFVKDYSREAQLHQISGVQEGLITDFPAYIVVFLIHLLAHDTSFPPVDCLDEETYARFCSPLFVLLQALINASNADGALDIVKDSVLYLICIFRAIKRSEDVIDVERTSKLHILADIGHSFVTLTNRNGLSASHAPGQILLPSSLYKSNSRSLTHSCFDEHFVKRVIQIFKSNISLPASTLPKRGRKCQEDRTQADVVKDSKLILASCKMVNLSKDGRAEAQKPEKEGNSTGGRRRKRALSPSAPGSVAFHDCSNNDYPSGVSKKSETSLEKEILSSCDSVATISSLGGSNVSIQNVKSNTIDVEHSNHPRAKLKGPCSLKAISKKAEALVGQRIKFLSPVDKCFYSGTVDGYNSQKNTHKITCDSSGDVQLVCLASESWETISDGSLEEKQKQKVGRKASVDTPASEITDTNEAAVPRRTRRQKKLN
ncbi:PREDICTED: sister chromatid cohesion protein PDS5 homolog A isoform X1 [Prunus mume]|uniref:Sister chromatid cohesion protein PDS5 homolog A isoform X1 n=1 Tax=Prunus mume TaxID=102107 RepID=A0ABM0N526_PRUMU|nr:PREDICTED: sister chromatid cohesion protein PDS5 homolog A isoform X1 [Prunus mume]